MVTTQGGGAPGSGGAVDTEAGGAGEEAEREARRRRMRAAVRDRMVALRLTQRELGKRARLSESSVARLLSGERQPTVDTLERVAAALLVPVSALLAGDASGGLAGEASLPALTAPGLSYAPGASLQSPERSSENDYHEAEAGGGGMRVGAAAYPAFALWGRTDPRDAAAPPAGGDERRVMRELGSGLGGPEDVFAVLVGDETLAGIETGQGRVRAGWRLFVDRRTAATARPGTVVAGMSATGRLVVGELEGRPGGDWSVDTGVRREALAGRDDVLGEVVEYQPPPAAVGHVVREPGRAGAEGTYYVGDTGDRPAAARAG